MQLFRNANAVTDVTAARRVFLAVEQAILVACFLSACSAGPGRRPAAAVAVAAAAAADERCPAPPADRRGAPQARHARPEMATRTVTMPVVWNECIVLVRIYSIPNLSTFS